MAFFIFVIVRIGLRFKWCCLPSLSQLCGGKRSLLHGHCYRLKVPCMSNMFQMLIFNVVQNITFLLQVRLLLLCTNTQVLLLNNLAKYLLTLLHIIWKKNTQSWILLRIHWSSFHFSPPKWSMLSLNTPGSSSALFPSLLCPLCRLISVLPCWVNCHLFLWFPWCQIKTSFSG